MFYQQNNCVLRTGLLLLEEVKKNVNAWWDLSFVSKLTGYAENYPFCCVGTKTEVCLQHPKVIFNINQISSYQHWNASTFY